jgi:RNase H-like domain found in reverse transcriptase
MRRWPIIEKEAYAILASCERLDWLLQRPDGFSLFTDHHKLLYVFNPHGQHSSMSAHSAAKLIRWELKMSSYRYTIEQVAGADNVWSDMLTRWAAPPCLVRISTAMLAPVAPSLDESFVWPTAQEIRLVQDAARFEFDPVVATSDTDADVDYRPVLADDNLYRTSGGQVWITSAAHDLRLRICIVAHTGQGGHRGLSM